ncbi:DUF1428 domain-containing protein [Candidatus Peregrinibacteria bacterium CG_4_9_14_0_2_um_filter_53_11]|nr:MAG: DUF1428 domain-containing protein [Candidatus Peregrinibacteria bacterium CG_4_9_14_0_2_um_filter_53_11]
MSTLTPVKYVDGFVFVVEKGGIPKYRKMAQDGGKVWMKHGALSYKECQLEHATPEFVTLTFPKLAKLKPGETVWFSYIGYKSKAHRDSVNKKVMKEFEEQKKDGEDPMKDMPFDMKRMSYGGFKVEVGF